MSTLRPRMNPPGHRISRAKVVALVLSTSAFAGAVTSYEGSFVSGLIAGMAVSVVGQALAWWAEAA